MHPPIKTTFQLEMSGPDELRTAVSPSDAVVVRRIGQPSPEFNWFFHEVIGSRYNWGGRDGWTLADWRALVEQAGVETWVAYWDEAPAGYFEVERQTDGSDRVLCFGLLEAFIGRGLGGYLLTKCCQRCWERGANRIWLRTCTHDHPHAIANYKSRGFKLVETIAADKPATKRVPKLADS